MNLIEEYIIQPCNDGRIRHLDCFIMSCHHSVL